MTYISSVEKDVIEQNNRLSTMGAMLEADFLEVMSKKYKRLENRVNSLADKHEGTDFILNGVRIDTTLKFSDKDFMPFVYKTNIPATPYENFAMGIRIGNSHKNKITHEKYTEFPEPVVVIGLDMTPYEYKKWEDVIEDNFARYADDIVLTLNDVYLTYITQDPEERDGLEIPYLMSNKNYKQPKNIGSQFSQLNDLQYALQQLEDVVKKNEKGETI